MQAFIPDVFLGIPPPDVTASGFGRALHQSTAGLVLRLIHILLSPSSTCRRVFLVGPSGTSPGLVS
ncbi:hypothetical protein BO78DRAFT_400171 [Aspergillus sclerotiicarbonarius CBS 121057]|uniref:Uncharacterized protein n=1 Tax=Aspergillus sclerotiicarbonarius (strain CBS 121057 / IBT 28362) TaxID=1448318 RepID=A0A319DYK4_ASPSB|nr:hypothetical protein BO78DRAFT_400171 [Aspergillus sclerotiicarbonarius CBS 121057]